MRPLASHAELGHTTFSGRIGGRVYLSIPSTVPVRPVLSTHLHAILWCYLKFKIVFNWDEGKAHGSEPLLNLEENLSKLLVLHSLISLHFMRIIFTGHSVDKTGGKM